MESVIPNPTAPQKKRKRLGPRSIRGRLLAGLLIITPLVITVFVVRGVFDAALWMGRPLVDWAMRGLRIIFNLDPTQEIVLGRATNIVAVLLTAAMLYILGALGSNVVGLRLIGVFESLLVRIPFIDTVYNAVKRTLHALSGPPGGDSAKQVVVLVEFPSPEMKTIGFMTNTITDTKTGRRYAAVYIPTTPNPTSGYMELVPVEKVEVTDWTMDQALSAILSGGASAPTSIEVRKLTPIDATRTLTEKKSA